MLHSITSLAAFVLFTYHPIHSAMVQDDSDYAAHEFSYSSMPRPVSLFADANAIMKTKAAKSKGSKSGGGEASCIGGCAVDCVDFSLETTDAAGNGHSGNMFTVIALQDLEITSFAVNFRTPPRTTTATDSVRVYTREGSYIGFEDAPPGWELIHDVLLNDLIIDGLDNGFTDLGDFVAPISVCNGTERSFFVFSEAGFDYTNGGIESDVYVFDLAMEILEGVGSSAELSNTTSIYSPRVWNGIVR